MSKIYEALLRAERERAEVDSGASATESAREAPAAVLTQEQTPADWTLRDRPPAVTVRADHASSGVGAATARGSLSQAPRPAFISPDLHGSPTSQNRLPDSAKLEAIDLSEVRPRTWTPLFSQLPSLEERGSAVEQFRSLRSRMYEFRDLNKLKSLLVSSGLPQEGKSFITANLAISFAKHKASRVLLIDGDMRRSSLHKMLGAPNDVGLSDYLGGKATLLEAMQRADTGDLPLPPGLASLTFIAGGTDSEKAADLSGNHRFDHLIASLSPHFDWIVVDSSPVNLVADGVNLARACDGVLLIARAGTTKYETAQRALSELKASRILGLVLNAVKKPPITGGYYGYDSYDAEKREPEPSTK